MWWGQNSDLESSSRDHAVGHCTTPKSVGVLFKRVLWHNSILFWTKSSPLLPPSHMICSYRLRNLQKVRLPPDLPTPNSRVQRGKEISLAGMSPHLICLSPHLTCLVILLHWHWTTSPLCLCCHSSVGLSVMGVGNGPFILAVSCH